MITHAPLRNPTLAATIVALLEKHGRTPTKNEIVEAGGSSPTNISRNLKRLEEAGHLDRSADPWTIPGHTRRMLRAIEGTTTETALPEGLAHITATSTDPNPRNPRRTVDEADIERMAASLLAHDQKQNIGVRQMPDGRYQAIFGSTRVRAAHLNIERGDWPADRTLLARIYPAEMSEADILELALSENMQRRDVDPYEQAQSFYDLYRLRVEELGSDQDATKHISHKLPLGQRTVQQYVKVARDLCEEAQRAFQDGRLTLRMAIRVARLEPDQQADLMLAMDPDHYNPVRTERDIANWISDSQPLSRFAIFDINVYRQAGGDVIPENEAEPDGDQILLSSTLARNLQVDALRKQLTERASELCITNPPDIVASIDWDVWTVASDDVPAHLLTIVARITPDLSTIVHEKMIRRDTLTAWRQGKSNQTPDAGSPTFQSDGTETTTDQPITVTAKPLTQRHWRAGAVERTRRIRETISRNPSMAMALTISCLAGCSGYDRLLNIRIESPTGDQHAISDDPEMLTKPDLTEIIPDYPKNFVDQKHTRDLIKSLLELPQMELESLFSRFIAATCFDTQLNAGPGATAQALGLVDFMHNASNSFDAGQENPIEDDLDALEPDQLNADWLGNYDRTQLITLAQSLELLTPEQIDAAKAWKKSELISAIVDARQTISHWTPAECRFVDGETALALAVKQTVASA